VPVTPSLLNAQYTAIATAGTTTINANQGAQGQGVGVAIPGALYGVNFTNLGTATGTFTAAIPAVNIYDIIPAQGNNAVTTNTLMVASGAALGSVAAGIYSIGVRYRGALVAVTTVTNGTAGALNVLWD
jgi:hypothetical protein